jgi:hypothetical protein
VRSLVLIIQRLVESNIVGEGKGGRNVGRLRHFLRSGLRYVVEIEYRTS